MPLAITDDHRYLADVVRTFVANHGGRTAARATLDDPAAATPPFWKEIQGLGWLGLHLPEEHGGEGFGIPELAVVLAELGRAVVPGPLLATALTSAVLAEAGDETLRAARLPGLADGSRRGAVALAGRVEGDDSAVSGTVPAVLDGAGADVLLVPVGNDLAVLDRGATGLQITPSTPWTARGPSLASTSTTSLRPGGSRALGPWRGAWPGSSARQRRRARLTVAWSMRRATPRSGSSSGG
jgi:hypothetical protein